MSNFIAKYFLWKNQPLILFGENSFLKKSFGKWIQEIWFIFCFNETQREKFCLAQSVQETIEIETW